MTLSIEIELAEIRCRVEAIRARLGGMEVDNLARSQHGYSVAWPSDCFFETEMELEKLVERCQLLYGALPRGIK